MAWSLKMKSIAGEDFKRGQFVYIVKRHWLLRMLGFKPKVYVVRGP